MFDWMIITCLEIKMRDHKILFTVMWLRKYLKSCQYQWLQSETSSYFNSYSVCVCVFCVDNNNVQYWSIILKHENNKYSGI